VRLHQVKNAFVHGCRAPGRVRTWMEVSGNQSERISVMGNDLAMRQGRRYCRRCRQGCGVLNGNRVQGRRDPRSSPARSVQRIQVVFPRFIDHSDKAFPRSRPVGQNRYTFRGSKSSDLSLRMHSTNSVWLLNSHNFESRNRLIFMPVRPTPWASYQAGGARAVRGDGMRTPVPPGAISAAPTPRSSRPPECKMPIR